MGLSREEVIQLYTAGTVTFPERFPEVGLITIEPKGIPIAGTKGSPLVQVEHRVSLDQTITYLLPLKNVAAILWAPSEEEEEIEAIGGDWVLGEELEGKLSALAGKSRRGIVYALESSAVLGKIVMAKSAGEMQLLGIPCCP
jgi:hypothetical protein